MSETENIFNQDRGQEELIQNFDCVTVETETLARLEKWEVIIRIIIGNCFCGQEIDITGSRWFLVALFCTRRIAGTQAQSYDTFIGKTLLNFELLLQAFQETFGEWKK